MTSSKSFDSANPIRTRSQVVVVTGLSGAGKSTALNALEDLGFYCCDNVPTAFAPGIVEVCERGGIDRVGLGIDARLVGATAGILDGPEQPKNPLGSFFELGTGELMQLLDAAGQRDLHVLFLDASDESIVRRFSETRRPHPLAPGGDVLSGIRTERETLAPLRAHSTRVIDTTRLTVHDLRRMLVAQFGAIEPGSPGRMVARLVSFGFKYGAPVDADVLFDVRFLANPYFVPELKHRPGTDRDVAEFVLSTAECEGFVARIEDLLAYSIPFYAREGKSYLTVGIGCTGGRHRSVAIAETLGNRLATRGIELVTVVHRDVGRGDVAGSRGSDPGPPPRAAIVPTAEAREQHPKNPAGFALQTGSEWVVVPHSWDTRRPGGAG